MNSLGSSLGLYRPAVDAGKNRSADADAIAIVLVVFSLCFLMVRTTGLIRGYDGTAFQTFLPSKDKPSNQHSSLHYTAQRLA